MGWLGSLFDTAFSAVKKIVAPGFEFTPSGIIKEVGHLTSMVAESIPGVGPFIGHAVGALTSGLSSSPSPGNPASQIDENNLNQRLDAILSSIGDLKKSMKASQKTISDEIQKAVSAIEDMNMKNLYNQVNSLLITCIDYMTSQGDDINELTPRSGDLNFGQFILLETTGNRPQMLKNFDQLVALGNLLQQHLDTLNDPSYAHSRHLLELYLLVVGWTLTYGKTILHLYAYNSLAQMKKTNYKGYINAKVIWRGHLKEMIIYVNRSVQFLLGQDLALDKDGNITGDQGLIAKLRDKRYAAVLPIAADSVQKEFVDLWDKSAVGYAGLGNTAENHLAPGVPDAATPEGKRELQVLRTAYLASNMAYFDHEVQYAILAAESWRKSVLEWKTRIPLSPPPVKAEEDGNAADDSIISKTHLVSEVKEHPEWVDESQSKALQEALEQGYGYNKHCDVAYSVSYITVQGEGVPGGYTGKVEMTELKKQFIKLTVNPVKLAENSYTKFKGHKPAKEEKPTEEEEKARRRDIRQRVYVRVINFMGSQPDKEQYMLVGEVPGIGGEIWDFGERAQVK